MSPPRSVGPGPAFQGQEPEFLWGFFFLRFHLFIYRQKGREGQEKEKEGNIDVWLPLARPPLGTWPTTQARALTGNRTSDPLVRRPALNPLSHTTRGRHLSLWRVKNMVLVAPENIHPQGPPPTASDPAQIAPSSLPPRPLPSKLHGGGRRGLPGRVLREMFSVGGFSSAVPPSSHLVPTRGSLDSPGGGGAWWGLSERKADGWVGTGLPAGQGPDKGAGGSVATSGPTGRSTKTLLPQGAGEPVCPQGTPSNSPLGGQGSF